MLAFQAVLIFAGELIVQRVNGDLLFWYILPYPERPPMKACQPYAALDS